MQIAFQPMQVMTSAGRCRVLIAQKTHPLYDKAAESVNDITIEGQRLCCPTRCALNYALRGM